MQRATVLIKDPASERGNLNFRSFPMAGRSSASSDNRALAPVEGGPPAGDDQPTALIRRRRSRTS